LGNSTTTNQFKYEQVQLVQFGQNSDTIWLISPPNLQLLNNALIAANYTPALGNISATDPNPQKVQIVMISDFSRDATQANKG
jgi:hypothetical protein